MSVDMPPAAIIISGCTPDDIVRQISIPPRAVIFGPLTIYDCDGKRIIIKLDDHSSIRGQEDNPPEKKP